MTSATRVDLDACAAEPIRVPGAIQPHGALVVLDPASLVCLHLSENLLSLTGIALQPGDLLPSDAGAKALSDEIGRWAHSDDPTLFRIIPLPAGPRQVSAHRTGQGLIVEFESPPQTSETSLEGMYQRLGRFLDHLATANDLASITARAVGEVRVLTRFDRVLLYSFDDKGDGTVLAEDSNGVLPSYLGLRFPASDIPQQARELYVLNRIRLIADASYRPVPIVPPLNARDGQSLDLSQAALRSVSPVHLEYMRNMGTGSSMSISIIVEGRLWGLISGHSRAPQWVSPQVRTACDILGQVLSLHIATLNQAAQTREQLALKEIEAELIARLAAAPTYQRGLTSNAGVWMSLTGAQGAAIVTAEQIQTVGVVPPEKSVRDIVSFLAGRNEELFVTDCLADHLSWATDIADVASGLIAISVSQIHADYILWFRPEVVRIVEWSGNPAKSIDPDHDRLHPRKSFELWKEQVKLHSLPWSTAQVECARGFRSSIQTLVLRRAEERAEMTERLQRVNKELEAFSYSISHDLRAPFRHIVGYAELLADRERTLDQTSKHYIATIKEAAVSAGRLVDDLLHFSQLGRTQLNVTNMDLNKLVSEVRRSLDPDIRNREIEWDIATLPPARGDASLIRQVLLNLVQNALKYSRPRKVARVSISGQTLPQEVSYTISDNGVGFEMQYVGKLFGVFQRLHRAEDFEGTGIGLALCKRIIDRHGGSITATGTPGEGASFTFTLPRPPTLTEGKSRG